MAVWLSLTKLFYYLQIRMRLSSASALHALMGQQFFAFNTVSDAFVVFDIEGAAVRTALAKRHFD